jgi:hypothetical protein
MFFKKEVYYAFIAQEVQNNTFFSMDFEPKN